MFKKCSSLMIFALSCSLLTRNLAGKETESSTIKVPCYSGTTITDVEALKDFASITFFLSIPNTPTATKIENLAVQRLKQFGVVVPIKFSIQNPLKNGLFKNPFLTYEIQQIEDINGKTLPIYKASLVFEASSRIEKNKQFCHSVLWSRSCFLQSNDHGLAEGLVLEALDSLLLSFEKDFQEANQDHSIKPTLYFAEL